MAQNTSTLNRYPLPLGQTLWQISEFGGRLISFLIDFSTIVVTLAVVSFLLLVDFPSTVHAVFVRGATEQSAWAASLIHSMGFWGLSLWVSLNAAFNFLLLATTSGRTWKMLGGLGETLCRILGVRFSQSERKLFDLGFGTVRLELRLGLLFFGLLTFIDQVTLVVINSDQVRALVEDLPRILLR